MTPAQIRLVQQSFEQVAPIAEAAAGLFYDRLFAMDPALRPLFARADMAEQGRKLMQAIGFVVRALDTPAPVLAQLRALGQRHVGYGVQPGHYATVGAALLWTLEQGLGDGFTPDVRDAWTDAYGLVAATMVAAARDPLPPQQQEA